MDELLEIIINMIVGLMGNKTPPPPQIPQQPQPMQRLDPTRRQVPLPRPNSMRRPVQMQQRTLPQNPDAAPPLWRRPIDPRLAGQTRQMKELAAIRKPIGPAFRGITRKSANAAPPPLPTPVSNPIMPAPQPAAPRAEVVTKRAESIKSATIHRMIKTQPAALQTIILLSEVIRPPLALRKSMREML